MIVIVITAGLWLIALGASAGLAVATYRIMDPTVTVDVPDLLGRRYDQARTRILGPLALIVLYGGLSLFAVVLGAATQPLLLQVALYATVLLTQGAIFKAARRRRLERQKSREALFGE